MFSMTLPEALVLMPSADSSAVTLALADLPPDVLEGLLGRLRPQAFALLACTCRQLQGFAKEPHSWAGEGRPLGQHVSCTHDTE